MNVAYRARAIALAAAVVAFAWIAKPSHAFIYFTVTGGPGQSALVAEQIVPSALGFDYQFYVANTGVFAIDGFSVYLPGGPAQPLQYDSFGPAPFEFYGALGNAAVPYLSAEANAMAWGFQSFDDRVAPGGPLTTYEARWYQAGGTPVLPAAFGPFFFYTRFDLFSPLGPVAGGGAVDPPAFAALISIDIDGTRIEGSLDVDQPTGSDNPLICDGTDDPAHCGQPLETRDEFLNAQFVVPEPGTLLLLLVSGLLAAGLVRRRT